MTKLTPSAISVAYEAQSPYEGGALAPLTPMAMIDRALSNGSGIEVIERLMALQERWEANQGRKAFDRAIADAKAGIGPIIKDRRVDFTSAKGRTNYQHEDMAGIARVVDPVLGQFGLSYRYRTAQDGRNVTVTCIVSHREGYSEETTLSSAVDDSGNKNHLQAVGSAITYLQRYTLKAALGLAAAYDDDAKNAGGGDKAGTMSADEFQSLRAEIDKLGDDASVAEAYILKRCDAEALDFLTKQQCADAMTLVAQRIKLRAAKGK